LYINLKGINVIVGNYGSGKTEISINLAINQKRSGKEVKIGDVDLVNPYFRTREAIQTLSNIGIDVICPPTQYLQADLPILTPAIKGMINSSNELIILDVGGDDVGARVLSALADAFYGQNIRIFQVINPFRPFTNSISGCLKIKKEIEQASRLNINGLIGNANLIDETTIDIIYEGYDFVSKISKQYNLPLEFITASIDILPQIDLSYFDCAILPLERQLVPPWKKAKPLGPKNFILH